MHAGALHLLAHHTEPAGPEQRRHYRRHGQGL